MTRCQGELVASLRLRARFSRVGGAIMIVIATLLMKSLS
jgi:hypothetical protein